MSVTPFRHPWLDEIEARHARAFCERLEREILYGAPEVDGRTSVRSMSDTENPTPVESQISAEGVDLSDVGDTTSTAEMPAEHADGAQGDDDAQVTDLTDVQPEPEEEPEEEVAVDVIDPEAATIRYEDVITEPAGVEASFASQVKVIDGVEYDMVHTPDSVLREAQRVADEKARATEE